MKKVTARAVCEGAIVAALTVLLMFMGIYVPVFRTLAMFVCGIPLAYLMIRQGVYISAASFIASLLLIFIVTGDIISGPLSGLITLLPGLVIGYCMSHNCRYYVTLASGIAAVLFGLVLDVMILNVMAGGENGIAGMLDETIISVQGAMNTYISSVENSADMGNIVSEALKQTKEIILTYFPTILVVAASVMGYIITSLCIFFMKRFRVKNYEYVRFYMIKVPKSLSVVTVLLMIVSFMSNDSSIYTLALKNVVAVLSFVLVIDGLSLVDFSLRKKFRSGYSRFGIYLLILILGYFFISIIFYILMFAGMLDANIDIRMLKKAGDDSES